MMLSLKSAWQKVSSTCIRYPTICMLHAGWQCHMSELFNSTDSTGKQTYHLLFQLTHFSCEYAEKGGSIGSDWAQLASSATC